MLNRSSLPIESDGKSFSGGYPASCVYFTQDGSRPNALHYHNCLEIGRCLNGSGVHFIGGEVYSFSGNSVSIVQKGCIHDARIILFDPNERPSEWQYLFVDLDALSVPQEMDRSFITADKDLAFLYDLMFRELEARPHGWQKQFCLLLQAFVHAAQRLEPNTRPMRHDAMADQIAAILHLIALEYAEPLSVEGLARRCNMSVSYFRKVFAANVGMSPQQYILHVRLSMAEHLVRTTSKQILTISEEVGFRSLSSFNRLFQKAYGCSPRALRK